MIRSSRIAAGNFSVAQRGVGVDGIERSGGEVFSVQAGQVVVVRELLMSEPAAVGVGAVLIDVWLSGGQGVRIHASMFDSTVGSFRLALQLVMHPGDSMALYFTATAGFDYYISGGRLQQPVQ